MRRLANIDFFSKKTEWSSCRIFAPNKQKPLKHLEKNKSNNNWGKINKLQFEDFNSNSKHHGFQLRKSNDWWETFFSLIN